MDERHQANLSVVWHIFAFEAVRYVLESRYSFAVHFAKMSIWCGVMVLNPVADLRRVDR